MGNVGRDPEVRFTNSGSQVVNFSMATENSWTKDGNKNTKTEWHNIVCWGHHAEYAEKYLRKGSLVHLEGRLQTREWLDKDQRKVRTTEIVVSEIHNVGPKATPDTEKDDQDTPPGTTVDGMKQDNQRTQQLELTNDLDVRDSDMPF